MTEKNFDTLNIENVHVSPKNIVETFICKGTYKYYKKLMRVSSIWH